MIRMGASVTRVGANQFVQARSIIHRFMAAPNSCRLVILYRSHRGPQSTGPAVGVSHMMEETPSGSIISVRLMPPTPRIGTYNDHSDSRFERRNVLLLLSLSLSLTLIHSHSLW